MSIIKAIPTIGPRGIQFRSRIEARWAYVFDKLNWNWEYEPIDLNGYIPDFIITFSNKNQLLVEVKGDMNIWDTYELHKKKIIDSGWKEYYLIVGSVIKEGEYFVDCPLVGIGGRGEDYDKCIIRKTHDKWGIGGEWMSYDLGLGDTCKDGKEWKHISEDSYQEFMEYWIDSQNESQWKGIQNVKTKISHNKPKVVHKAKLNLDSVDWIYKDGDTDAKCVMCRKYAGDGFGKFIIAKFDWTEELSIPLCYGCREEREIEEDESILFPDGTCYRIDFFDRVNV